jgi:hypothetical protein
MQAQNTLHVKLALKRNLSAQFFTVTADVHDNFNTKNALYYSTLSDTASPAEIQKAIARLQKISNTANVAVISSKSVERQIAKNLQ